MKYSGQIFLRPFSEISFLPNENISFTWLMPSYGHYQTFFRNMYSSLKQTVTNLSNPKFWKWCSERSWSVKRLRSGKDDYFIVVLMYVKYSKPTLGPFIWYVRRIYRKNNILHPLIRTYTYVCVTGWRK